MSLKKSFHSLFITLSLVIHCYCFASWEFIDREGDLIVFEEVPATSDLQNEENLFVSSFSEAYKDFSIEMLGVQEKEAFLRSAFADVREDFEKKDSFLITARIDNELVGFVEFKKTEIPGQIYIAQLAVSPKYWQRGIGRELVFSICKLTEGVNQLVAIGRRINARGRGFFTHIGFNECKYIYTGYDPKKYIGFEFDVK